MKGQRTYFENAELLSKVLGGLQQIRRDVQLQREEQDFQRKMRSIRYDVWWSEIMKVLDSLRNGQHIMISSNSCFRLARVDRSARGNLCIRKFNNKDASWARRRTSLTPYSYCRKLSGSQAFEYVVSLRWPSRNKLARTDRGLNQRIQARLKVEEIKVKSEGG